MKKILSVFAIFCLISFIGACKEEGKGVSELAKPGMAVAAQDDNTIEVEDNNVGSEDILEGQEYPVLEEDVKEIDNGYDSETEVEEIDEMPDGDVEEKNMNVE
ncbi:MAG: hypothetical protein V1872_07475, partial [bacterium]